MTIHSLTGKTNTVLTPSKPTQSAKANNPSVQSTETQGKNDQIDISTVADKITKALESSKTTPAINEERVNAVKKALEEGTYPIDAQKIAKKMMQMERDDNQLNNSR